VDKEADKQPKKSFNWLKEYEWQKGQSGNPKGRPKGKTLKEYSRIFLANMSDSARLEFLESLPPEAVWKMAEGMPSTSSDITSGGKPIPLFGYVQDNNSDNQGTETK